jgi:RNA polymerase sigma-70 factor (ECF subfamily)
VPREQTLEEDFRRRCVACLDGLYAFAVSLSRDPSLAEDLVQETYVRALRAARRPAPHEDVRPWLFTILHNVWRNLRRGRIAERLETLPDGFEAAIAVRPQAEEALDRAAAVDRVERAIRELPDAYREVVMLRFGEGLSYQEIAAVLACPAGTVMSRLARARAQIRRVVVRAGLARVLGARR